MADYSLDDYFHKKGGRLAGRLGNRLGAKISPAKTAASNWRSNKTQGIKGRLGAGAGAKKPVFVSGVGKMKGGFDARQKINRTHHMQDAREKIQQKSNITDARIRIQNKKTGSVPGPVNTKLKPSTGPNDMRIKLNNALAKKSDARQMIQARKQAKQSANQSAARGAGPGGPAGLGSLGTVSVAEGGSLVRTIPGNQGGGASPFQKTIQNPRPAARQDHSNLISVRISNEPAHEAPPAVGYYQTQDYDPRASRPQRYAAAPQVPRIHVMNDMYQPQQAAPPPPPPRPTPSVIHYQPAYQQDDYYPEEYTTPATFTPMPRAKPAVRPAKAVAQPAVVSGAGLVSPLQGSAVLVSNLHPKVTGDDVVELFGVVGALKKAKLLKPGYAEVVFVKSEDAQSAVRKYHLRELDGQPMHVSVSNRSAQPAPPKRPLSPQIHQPLKLNSLETRPAAEAAIDPNLIHRALFKSTSRQEQPSKPVTFTVKI